MAATGEGKQQVFVPLGEQQEDEEAHQSQPTQEKVGDACQPHWSAVILFKAHHLVTSRAGLGMFTCRSRHQYYGAFHMLIIELRQKQHPSSICKNETTNQKLAETVLLVSNRALLSTASVASFPDHSHRHYCLHAHAAGEGLGDLVTCSTSAIRLTAKLHVSFKCMDTTCLSLDNGEM